MCKNVVCFAVLLVSGIASAQDEQVDRILAKFTRIRPGERELYPPGVMERTDPQTKTVYKIKAVEGKLSLTPAGSDNEHRRALLGGTVRLTDEGEDQFSYEGKLEVVLTYGVDDPHVKTLRGVFEGIYPRYDRAHGRIRHLPLQAVFESLR